jgi:hypothetical protein
MLGKESRRSATQSRSGWRAGGSTARSNAASSGQRRLGLRGRRGFRVLLRVLVVRLDAEAVLDTDVDLEVCERVGAYDRFLPLVLVGAREFHPPPSMTSCSPYRPS